MDKKSKSSSKSHKESKHHHHRHHKSSKSDKDTDDKHHKFDLEVVLRGFQGCMQQKDKCINLQEYINSFTELTRFFRMLSPIFGFVSNDLEEKLQTLEKHKSCSSSQHYETVESMIAHEVKSNITHGKTRGLNSGSRCVLRLNRSLEFILEFMARVASSKQEDQVSEIACEVYDRTLAKHHVWIVRKMARMAVYTLPDRQHFLENMCKQSEEVATELVNNVVLYARPVYDQIQSLGAQNQLMDIP